MSFDIIKISKDYDRQDATRDRRVRKQLFNLKLKIANQQEYVNDYHNTFDSLYKASEQIRFHQRRDFLENAKISAESCRKEIADIKLNRNRNFVLPNTIEFIPQHLEISDVFLEYFLKSKETGIPVCELIPPTFFKKAFHVFSSEEDTESSSNSDTTKSSSGGSSTTKSSSCGSTADANETEENCV
jgi:hypothetical protein